MVESGAACRQSVCPCDGGEPKKEEEEEEREVHL